MYAIVETGGKQVTLTVDEKVFVEKIEANVGDTITLDKVLLVAGESLKYGTPYLSGVTVTCEVLRQGRAKKIIVFKYRPKKNEKTKRGHRQSYTQLLVKSINL